MHTHNKKGILLFPDSRIHVHAHNSSAHCTPLCGVVNSVHGFILDSQNIKCLHELREVLEQPLSSSLHKSKKRLKWAIC